MRYKESIRLIKEALKQPWKYTPTELTYLRLQLKMTKKLLKKKRGFKGVVNESKSSNSDS